MPNHLTKRGLRIKRNARGTDEWYIENTNYYISLTNYWLMLGRVKHIVVTVSARCKGDTPDPVLYYAKGVRDAQWWATIHFLRFLINIVALDGFFDQALEQRSWQPLKVAGDWLEEQSNPKAELLRSYFPKERKKRVQPSDALGAKD